MKAANDRLDLEWPIIKERDMHRQAAEELQEVVIRLTARVAELEGVLELIAATRRADGTHNRGRDVCEELAREALGANGRDGVEDQKELR